MTNPVSIIYIGETHLDPTAKLAILFAIRACHEQKIPVVFCHESSLDCTLKDEQQRIANGLTKKITLIKSHGWDEYFYQEKRLLPYFDLTKADELLEKITAFCGRIQFPYNPREVLDGLIYLQTKQAEKRIYDYLIHNNLPYVPMDILDRESLLDKAYAMDSNEEQLDLIHQYENRRIQTMSQQIIEKGIKPLEQTGGILFCNVGNIHVQQLASTVSKQYAHKQSRVYCYSDCYVETGKRLSQEQLKSNNPSETTQPLHFQYVENKIKINSVFKSIVEEHMEHVKSARHTVTPKPSISGSTSVGLPFSIFKRSLSLNARPIPSLSKGPLSWSQTIKFCATLGLIGLICMKLTKPNAMNKSESTPRPK